jgi:hypothetical protein
MVSVSRTMYCKEQVVASLYVTHSPTRLHGVVFKLLSTGTTLPVTLRLKTFLEVSMYFLLFLISVNECYFPSLPFISECATISWIFVHGNGLLLNRIATLSLRLVYKFNAQ